MPKAQQGDTVKVHYHGTLEDGTVFDSSLEREPLEFTVGSGMVIEGFDTAVDGMEVAETKTVKLPPEQAYGDRSEELTFTVDRSMVPPDITPETGMMLQVRAEDNSMHNVTIAEVTDATITLDGNHPLAGKTLIFELTLSEIVK